MLVLGFTLFNSATLLILALTIALLVARLRLRLKGNWPLAYYAMALGYAFGFPHSLAPPAVLAGAACGVATRFKVYRREIRIAEIAVLLYVIWRCVALLMMW